MSQVKIVLCSLGYMPHFIDFDSLSKWKSKIFSVVRYDRIELLSNANGMAWSYSDEQLEEKVPHPVDGDFTLAVVNFPLSQNFYARRISDNRIAISTFEIADILANSDIPLENYILRMLYKYSAVFKNYSRIPVTGEGILSHNETRVCLFDMTPIKTDIVYSTEKLGLCEECRLELKRDGVSSIFLNDLEHELKRVKKGTYYRILGFIRRRPIIAIIISAIGALFVNLLSSFLYDLVKALFER